MPLSRWLLSTLPDTDPVNLILPSTDSSKTDDYNFARRRLRLPIRRLNVNHLFLHCLTGCRLSRRMSFSMRFGVQQIVIYRLPLKDFVPR